MVLEGLPDHHLENRVELALHLREKVLETKGVQDHMKNAREHLEDLFMSTIGVAESFDKLPDSTLMKVLNWIEGIQKDAIKIQPEDLVGEEWIRSIHIREKK